MLPLLTLLVVPGLTPLPWAAWRGQVGVHDGVAVDTAGGGSRDSWCDSCSKALRQS